MRFLDRIEVGVVNAAKRRWRDTFSSPVIWFNSATPIPEVADLMHALRPVAASRALIRIGGEGDGGYLVPDALGGVRACISPGVSTEVGFDLAMARRGIDVYMADASVDGPPVRHERFHFRKIFLDAYESGTTTTLDRFCQHVPDDGDWILQMDIEGAEYRVLTAASDTTIGRCRFIIVEFHDLDLLFLRSTFGHISSVFRRLLTTHRPVHIHPNNFSSVVRRKGISVPRGLEITFARNDFLQADRIAPSLPHGLDRDNTRKYPPAPLPACWRS